MKLKVKDVNLSAGGPFVAILNEDDAAALDLKPSDRIKITTLRKKHSATAIVDISTKGIGHGRIGLFEEVLAKLKLEPGVTVKVFPAPKPKSIEAIKRKLDGHIMTKEEFNELVKEIVNNELNETELTYFVAGTYTKGLTLQEVVHLTNAIVNNGWTFKFNKKIILDKHCIGGVPGNRTTMVIIPILAALGYTVPKTSSRAITSPSGTADTVEVLAPVALSKEKFKQVIKKTGACMAWGGAFNMAGADDKMIKIRHPLSIDPKGLLIASILAKKKAAGATHVLIDIPIGPTAKISNKTKAEELKKQFIFVGEKIGLKIKIIFTDGKQPIGNGIGPALEAQDVLGVLHGNGPNDLREKSIDLVKEILEMIDIVNGDELAIDALDSGAAYEKFKEIIQAQGGKKIIRVPTARYYKSITATKSGKVKTINNKMLSKIARIAGAPQDKVAGIYIRVKIGNKIKRDDVLFTIHTKSEEQMKEIEPIIRNLHPIEY
ncbi:MAG: AMP phosphorylase [archaeon]